MRRCFLILLCILSFNALSAQSDQNIFKGTFWNEENRIRIVLNLYEESIRIPGYDFLGMTNGYLSGNVYGTWLLTSFHIDNENQATLRFSDDRGADSQTVILTRQADSTFVYATSGGNAIRKVVGRKLVKIPSNMTFRRK